MGVTVKNKQSLILVAMAAANLVFLFALGYMMFSMRDSLTDRIAKIESSTMESSTQEQEQSSDYEKKMANVFSDLQLIKERIGVTSVELKRARETAQTLKRQQEQAAKELAG